MPSAENEVQTAVSPFSVEPGDAEAFLACAESLAAGLCALYRPAELHVVKIDNWFGPRWLRFSGKILGLAGFQRTKLTLPPFVPARVVFEHTLERSVDAGTYRAARMHRVFHIEQTSSLNLRRYVHDLAPTTAILWFSGGSAGNGHGSIMAQVPADGFHWSWYAGLAADQGWGLSTHKGISPVEFRHLRRAGEASEVGWRS